MEDKRIDRLFDYTKWHIGVYLSIAGGLAGIIGSVSSNKGWDFLNNIIGSRWALVFSLLFMMLAGIAGIAGGLIASTCTQFNTFDDLWNQKIGPYKLKIFTGEKWALIEHGSFWISIFLLAVSIFSSCNFISWVLHLA